MFHALPVGSATSPRYKSKVSGQHRFLTEWFEAFGNSVLHGVPSFTNPEPFRRGQMFLYRYHPFDRVSYQIWLCVQCQCENEGTTSSESQQWERIGLGYCTSALSSGPRFLAVKEDFTLTWMTKQTFQRYKRTKHYKSLISGMSNVVHP